MSTPTPAEFLTTFPEFDTSDDEKSDSVEFSPSSISFWITTAQKMVNQARWCDLYCLGVYLFTAHNLVLEALAMREMQAGGIPGVAKGSVAGKSAGDVTITYDTAAAAEENQGHWNYTIYGQRYIRMAQLMGMGPVQVGPDMGGGGCFNGPGWPGVIVG